jgi:hypothetical protein
MDRRRLLVTACLILVGGIAVAALDAQVDLSPVAALFITLAVGVPICVYATWDQLTGKPQ